MAFDEMRVKITFISPVVLNWPIKDGKMVIPKDEYGTRFIYEYHIKDFFKHACFAMSMIDGTASSKIENYEKVIDSLVFTLDKNIQVMIKGDLNYRNRLVTIQSSNGKKMRMINAEEIPEGSYIIFTIKYLDENLENAIVEWLNYGVFSGIGKERNLGKGTFIWKEDDLDFHGWSID